jgi:hypothetical protein
MCWGIEGEGIAFSLKIIVGSNRSRLYLSARCRGSVRRREINIAFRGCGSLGYCRMRNLEFELCAKSPHRSCNLSDGSVSSDCS